MNPTLQALWLVEDVTTDEATGKVTIVGLFNQIFVPPEQQNTAAAPPFSSRSPVSTVWRK